MKIHLFGFDKWNKKDTEKVMSMRKLGFTLLFTLCSLNIAIAGTVTNTNDSGAGSLRDVITNAVSGEIIDFSPSLLSGGSATIVLSSVITFPVPITVNGLIVGADTLYISGGSTTGIFDIAYSATYSSTTYLNDLVLMNGYQPSWRGGAVYCREGHLEVNNCVIRDNSAQYGGGIYMIGGNNSYDYVLTVNNSTFSGNTSLNQGGAIYCSDGPSTYSKAQVTAYNSTFYDNSAEQGGSSIYATSSVLSANFPGSVSSTIRVDQCTFTNNSDTFSYAATIHARSQHSNNSSSSSYAYVYLTNSTVSNNNNYGISSKGYSVGYIYTKSSIITFNDVRCDGQDKVESLGYNIFSYSTLPGTSATDQLGATAGTLNLGALAFNGGSTKTMLPLPGSIAIDNGSPDDNTDAQNGPISGIRDVGAAEFDQCANDIVAPVPDNLTLADITDCSVTSLIAPTATDNCSGAITGTHNVTLPITSNTTITWTYNDGNGNTSTQTQNVVIDDVTAPVADVATLSDITSECEVTSLIAPTATDNCSGSITGTHNATLPITSGTTVTWTYDDGNGNTSIQNQNVVINDVTAPVADAASLSAITSQCEITSLTAPTATDNCAGTITGVHDATLPITSSTTITWTYDDGNGNTSTQMQNVVINSDNTVPVADVASLSAITSECEITSLTAPTATDNCAGTITGVHNATLPITSSTTITWTYDDGNGNTSTQTQNVIINSDNTVPVADVASLSAITSECEITSLTAPTATDNCAGIITGVHNVTLPITSNTTITWTYDDGNGNTSTQIQNVMINDITAPVADNASLSPVNAECQINSIPAPTATDNCAGTITGTPNVSFPITVQGSFTITWTYNDGHGNTSTQTQNIMIDDVTNPVPDNAILSSIVAECEVTSLTAPTATDNCSGSITGTHNAILPITSGTTVTWTYDDGNGNTSTQTQNVVITPIDNSITQIDAITLSANATGYTYQWVDCDNGNAPIAGQTAQTFVATANGNYAVEVSDGTCNVTSSCTVINSVGIKENQLNNTVMVYPNPTNGQMNLQSDQAFNKIIVFNALGEQVEVYEFPQTNAQTITLDEPGVYFLQVQLLNTTTVIKAICEK